VNAWFHAQAGVALLARTGLSVGFAPVETLPEMHIADLVRSGGPFPYVDHQGEMLGHRRKPGTLGAPDARKCPKLGGLVDTGAALRTGLPVGKAPIVMHLRFDPPV